MMAVNGTAATFNSQFPGAAPPRTFVHRGWRIKTQKLPILKAEPIEAMTEKLGIAVPEMIFGDNYVSIEHESGWCIQFNAFDALDRVDKTGEKRLKVAYSKEWHRTRCVPLREQTAGHQLTGLPEKTIMTLKKW